MKGIERPAKRIFSQNKETEKIVKTDKSAKEKTLALIAVKSTNSKVSVNKKRKIVDSEEKKQKKKKDLQTATDAPEFKSSSNHKGDAKHNEELPGNLADSDDENSIKDEEIENSLKIANQVLENNDIEITSKSSITFKDVSALRFDPDKEIQKEPIQTEKKSSKKKSVTFDANTKTEEKLPKVKESLYYEVKTSLKEAFTSSAEQPFSLLASFGDPDVPVEAEISSDEETQEPGLEENEDSNDEEFEADPLTDAGAVSVNLEDIPENPDKTFFFMTDDERLTEGVKKFHRTLEEEEMWDQWKEQKKKIRSLFHTRQKHIVRRLNYKKSAVFKNESNKKN